MYPRPGVGAKKDWEDAPDRDEAEGGGPDDDEDEAPRCDYSSFDVIDSKGGYDSPDEVDSERQLRLDRGEISRTLCASVLAYDVLGLVVTCFWGMTTLRFYSILFGRLAGVNNALYVISCLVYAFGTAASAMWIIASFFPSPEELKMRRESLKPYPSINVCSDLDTDTGSAPLLEHTDAASVEEELAAHQKYVATSPLPTSPGQFGELTGSCCDQYASTALSASEGQTPQPNAAKRSSSSSTM